MSSQLLFFPFFDSNQMRVEARQMRNKDLWLFATRVIKLASHLFLCFSVIVNAIFYEVLLLFLVEVLHIVNRVFIFLEF